MGRAQPSGFSTSIGEIADAKNLAK